MFKVLVHNSLFKNTVESVYLAYRIQQKMAWRAQTFGKAYTQSYSETYKAAEKKKITLDVIKSWVDTS